MNYYRHYMGDYLRDTARLNLTEHGAYRSLMDYYYAEEKPLPIDHEELFLMVRAMRPEDRIAVEKVLGLYFSKRAQGYHHKRIDHEIEVSQKARQSGAKGGRPRTAHETDLVTESLTEIISDCGTVGITGEGGDSGHPPTTILQPPSTSLQPPRKATASSAGLTEILPSNIPYKEIVALFNEHMAKLPKVRELTNKRRALIRSAWQASKKRQSMKFWKAYFEECSEEGFLNGDGPYGKGHENWQPSFDYLLKNDVVTRTYEKAMQRAEA